MRRPFRTSALLCICMALALPPTGVASRRPASRPAERRDARAFDARPMLFEPNLGQTDSRAKFVARGAGYAVFLGDDEVVLALGGQISRPAGATPERGSVGTEAAKARGERPDSRAARRSDALRLRLAGARAGARPAAERPLASTSNYLVGGDASRWVRDVPNYEAVRYEGVYDGIDAVFYGTQKQLEYDFVVRPGADPGQIRVRFEGHERAEVDESGDLVLTMRGGEVRQQRAYVYQEEGAGRREVGARYLLGADGEVGFALDGYDPAKPLVVDPVVVYAGYLGGSYSRDDAWAIAVDAAGAIYVTGYTRSSDFPRVGGGTIDGEIDYDGDAFVTKLNPDGVTVAYSTYLGGDGVDIGRAIAVDSSGAAYVAGFADGAGFPTTPGAYDTSTNGLEDAFVVKVSLDGTSLVYATFLGGVSNDLALGIAIDASGAACVAGYTFSLDFPTTPGALDTSLGGGGDAFATKLSPDGSSLLFSTFVGGNSGEECHGVAIDAAGAVFLAGVTGSSDFPATPGAYDTSFNGGADVFVAQLAGDGSSLGFATFVGGASIDRGMGMAVDASGAVYVTGYTTSPSYPTTPGSYDTTGPAHPNGAAFGFVTKVSAGGGTLVYSTFLDGSRGAAPSDIAVDAAGAAHVTGRTSSPDFPVTGGVDTTLGGGSDAFVTKLNPEGAALVYSTFLGGNDMDEGEAIAIDSSDRAVVAGFAGSSDFPVTSPVPAASRDFEDFFVTRLSTSGGTLVSSTTAGGVLDAGSSGVGDAAVGVAAGPDGAMYVIGGTYALNVPTTPGAFDAGANGLREVFVAKLAADGALVYSTYLGGARDDDPSAIAVDAEGRVAVAGITYSPDFPTTEGAYDRTLAGEEDVFVARLSASGSALVYSTLLGAGGSEAPTCIAIDPSGAVLIAGETYSTGFPTTPGAYDTTPSGGSDAFVTKLTADGGALVVSTRFGGSGFEGVASMALDAEGTIYLAGETGSGDLPTTPDAHDATLAGFKDAFAAKLTAGGDALLYATYLGGDSEDGARGVAAGPAGEIYVTGHTSSSNFPTTPGAFDPSPVMTEAFVTKLDGSSLLYSTFLGGRGGDFGVALAVDPAGAAYVVGNTGSADYPTTPDAHGAALGDFTKVAVTKLAADGGSILYSTLLGGNGYAEATGMAYATPDTVYVAGFSYSTDFPSTGYGPRDIDSAFVARLTTQVPGTETVGVYAGSGGAWFLRDTNGSGPADLTFVYGPSGAGWRAVAGDWDGDGTDTPGLYDPATGFFFLRNAGSPGAADLTYSFGPAGAGWVPIAGDWDGDGTDTVGLYDPAAGAFFLRNSHVAGAADLSFFYGPAGAGWLAVAGDWDGNGVDTVGLYDPVSGFFFLRNANAPGAADLTFSFGAPGSGWTPVTGDWDGDGTDTVGLHVPSNGFFFLRNANEAGAADLTFSYGPPGVSPLGGNWDGQ